MSAGPLVRDDCLRGVQDVLVAVTNQLVTTETPLVDLDLDSLRALRLVTEIEDTLGFELNDALIERVMSAVTVGDVVETFMDGSANHE